MAGSVNKVTLIGNLARDPEIRTTSNGEVANMRLITSESWNDKDSGERRERSEGHNIVIYNERLINVVKKYCKKGDKLYIEGALTTRKYQDKNGNDVYTTEVVLQRYRGELEMLGGAKGDSDFSGDDADGGRQSRTGGDRDNGAGNRARDDDRQATQRGGNTSRGRDDDFHDDDVPF